MCRKPLASRSRRGVHEPLFSHSHYAWGNWFRVPNRNSVNSIGANYGMMLAQGIGSVKRAFFLGSAESFASNGRRGEERKPCVKIDLTGRCPVSHFEVSDFADPISMLVRFDEPHTTIPAQSCLVIAKGTDLLSLFVAAHRFL